ncbi:MAG: ZIP family metal transporter [Actinomycetota bacterium]
MDVPGSVWFFSLVAVLGISAISLLGAASMVFSERRLRQALVILIAFAAGALLGDAFLHLLPETVEAAGGLELGASFSILVGVGAFFILEKGLHWHHAHLPHRETFHPVAVTNLVGDGLHNFVDGAIVGAAFAASTTLGVATTIAVALHEIPQELGDFSILLHAGLKPRRALLLNFLTGLAALAGAVVALAFTSVSTIEGLFVPFTAGAFIYIAGTDLMPEIHKEPEPLKSVLQLLAFGAGVGTMAVLLVLE